MIRLEEASLNAPRGLLELLEDIGDGENGFGGTKVHSGEMTVDEYLQRCVDMKDGSKTPESLVPWTTFWAINDHGLAVGQSRIRHYLNEKLLINGGNISYYVKKDQRGKSYGKEILRLALLEFKALGNDRALITVYVENSLSIKTVEANGGKFCDITTEPGTNQKVNRYWIDLKEIQ